ncbi:serine/threonine-protein kinase [Nocardiopsis sp. CC223A]|uniref:serine/threonine-protein kinase n=1 Tax=Nocardiopsis sp. CC223A TaxID=3044051 RepID=UPI00278C1C95|nr:serine/threonine-protein kinase [Nocardiopsis sp. CC223A]
MVDIGSEIGGHRLVRRLGSGGFGTVFLGEHRHGHRAAVKVLHRHHLDDPRVRERFDREVESAKKVRQFCTARVLDADPRADTPWIATEYVDGPPLSAVVREKGRRTDGDLYRLAVSTATALVAIHEAGVVHRDFKPDNILLGTDGVRVIDFGISRILNPENSREQASIIMGTPRYMAPEQLRGRAVTPAIDLFAWGAVMVFAATGRPAFDVTRPAAVMPQILHGRPQVEGVPDELLPLVRRCLDKNPENRPSAWDVLVALLGRAGGTPGPSAPKAGGAGAWPGGAVTAQLADTVVLTSEELQETLGAAGDPTTTVVVPVEEVREVWETVRRSHPPLTFGGEEYISPSALAAAFQANWRDALDLLQARGGRGAERLDALKSWELLGAAARKHLGRPLPDGAAERGVFLAGLVARMDPALPPTYDGNRYSWHRLVDDAGAPEAFLARNEEALRSGLLDAFALHHCRTPDDHRDPERDEEGNERGCVRGAPCKRYGRTAENLRGLLPVADARRGWNDLVAGIPADTVLRVPLDVPDLVALAHRNAASPTAGSEDLKARATGELDLAGAELLHRVGKAVEDAPEPEKWAVATVLREARPQLAAASRARMALLLRSERARVVRREPVQDETAFFYGGMSALLIVFAGVALLLGAVEVAAILGAIGAGAAVVGAATAPGRRRRLRRARLEQEASSEDPPSDGIDAERYDGQARALERALEVLIEGRDRPAA